MVAGDDPNYDGTDSVVYESCDDHGACGTATLYLHVIDTPPLATDDEPTVFRADVLTGNVITENLGNGPDTDLGGDQLTVTSVNGVATAVGSPIRLASGAMLTVHRNGSYSYDTNGQFDDLDNGDSHVDSFTYTISDGHGGYDTATVSVTVTGDNLVPHALDDYARTRIDEPVTLAVMDNDHDPEGKPLSVILVSVNEGGSASVNPDGTVTFMPDPGYTGVATIDYLVEDPSGAMSRATIVVDVFRPYIWDAFHEFSTDFVPHNYGVRKPENPVLAREIFTLAPEPIYSGYARPGTHVAGRIFDQSGRMIGEAFSTADPAGNWMMQMHGARGFEFYRIEFEYTHQSGDMYGYFGLNDSDNTYQALETRTTGDDAFDVPSVMSKLPESTLEKMHRESNRTLGLGNQ